MKLALPGFDPTDDIVFDDQILRLEREWDDGTLSLTRVKVNRPFLLEDGSAPTVEWFLTAFGDGSLTLRRAGSSPLPNKTVAAVDPNDRMYAKAVLVQFVCSRLDSVNCSLSVPAIADELDRILKPDVVARYGPKPPAATVKKWMKRGIAHDRQLAACRPSAGRGRRTPQLDSEVLKLRTDAAILFWSGREVSIEDAHADHVTWVTNLNADRASRGLPDARACGISWLRVRINELETRERYATKYGSKAADSRFKANGLGTRTAEILQLGIIDHQTFDSFCALDYLNGDLLPVGRPTVTAVYDDCSGCIASAVLHVTPPSLHNMLDALKHANRPKMRPTVVGADKQALLSSVYGRFDTILPDNAWEFTGTSGQDSLHDLGTSIDWSRAGMPQDKSKLERFWGTLTTYLASKLPGAVFDPKVMRELGYDPTKEKVVLLSDLRDLLAEAVAYYHLTGGKDGVQPARLWEKGVRRIGAIPVIRDDRIIDQLMGRVVEATLTTSGVKLFNRLEYTDLDAVTAMLNRMAGTSPKGRRRRRTGTARIRVKVKFNPADLSRIHVFDHVLQEYVTLVCREEYVVGLSLRHHEVLEDWTKAQNIAFSTPEQRKLARSTLNRLIREAAPSVAMRHRRKFAELVPGVSEGPIGDVAIAHAPSTYSGMAPTIGHDVAIATRTDGGMIPSGPRSRAHRAKKAASPRTRTLPVPTSGKVAKFDAMPARPATDADWGGLG